MHHCVYVTDPLLGWKFKFYVSLSNERTTAVNVIANKFIIQYAFQTHKTVQKINTIQNCIRSQNHPFDDISFRNRLQLELYKFIHKNWLYKFKVHPVLHAQYNRVSRMHIAVFLQNAKLKMQFVYIEIDLHHLTTFIIFTNHIRQQTMIASAFKFFFFK